VKRALYLAHLAMILRKSDLVQQVSYSHHHGSRLKPVLLLKPAGAFYCIYSIMHHIILLYLVLVHTGCNKDAGARLKTAATNFLLCSVDGCCFTVR